MSLRIFRFIATSLIAFTVSNSVVAQNTGQLVEVIAVGIGKTQDEAHEAADKAAVEQVVGTIVEPTTLVEKIRFSDIPLG